MSLQHKYGFSLIESAIVLSIVGLVIGGIWTAAAVVSENNKVNRMVEIIMTSTSKARRLFDRNLPTVQTLLTGPVCSAANIMPADAQTTSVSYCGISPWGKSIDFTVSLNVNGAPPASAKPGIVFGTLLSTSACRAVVSKILPSTSSYTLLYVVSDNGAIPGGAKTIPSSFCGNGETSLTFYFYMAPI